MTMKQTSYNDVGFTSCIGFNFQYYMTLQSDFHATTTRRFVHAGLV